MSKKKKSKKLKKAAKARMAKIDKKLLSASDALLTISVETGKKWHKLFKHSITVAEPIREKQIDMFFDTTDAVRDQLEEGADRFKKLLGIKEDIGDIVQKNISKNKIANQLANSANKLVSVVNESGLKDTIEKGAVKIKMEITDRFGRKKKDKNKKKKDDKRKKSSKKTKSTNTKKVKKVAERKTRAKATGRPAKRRGRPAGAGSKNKTTTEKIATTGAKRGPKPGAKRGPKPSAKRGPKSGTKRRATVKRSTGAKRGPKPKAGRPGYDDLKRIIGVGAKMEAILNKNGIKTYKDLKGAGVRNLQTIIDSAGGYYQSLQPKVLKTEASLAATGKFSQMKSGRK